MSKAYATVCLDNVTITYSCLLKWDDYGVPGSPKWLSPEEIEVESVEVLGVEIKGIDKLPKGFIEILYEYSQEVEEWEYEE